MKVFGIALFSALLTSFALFSADPPGLASAGGGSLDSDDETLQTAMKKVEKYTAQAKKMGKRSRPLSQFSGKLGWEQGRNWSSV